MAFGSDDDSGSDGYGKPVEEGKTYEVEVEDIGSKGDGIARVDGFVVFVPETDIGDRVEVEINSVGRKFAFGEVTERLGTVENPGETDEEPEEEAEAAEAAADTEEPELEEPADEPEEEAADDEDALEPDIEAPSEEELEEAEEFEAPEPAEEVCEMCGAPVDDPATHECDI